LTGQKCSPQPHEHHDDRQDRYRTLAAVRHRAEQLRTNPDQNSDSATESAFAARRAVTASPRSAMGRHAKSTQQRGCSGVERPRQLRRPSYKPSSARNRSASWRRVRLVRGVEQAHHIRAAVGSAAASRGVALARTLHIRPHRQLSLFAGHGRFAAE
jgi:hypothetical protein